MTGGHLWVVYGLAPVENLSTLVRPQRLLLGVEETGGVAFLPDPLVAIVGWVAGDDHRREWLGGTKHNGRLWLCDPQVLLPQWRERDDHVPGALGGAVG
ncbi:hypothetical protein D3C78_1793150 [compost metagenome]